jgi:FAD/FMN-containing dehydrogenase
VKGGGHATNPKFSSTSGVQIALSRFNEVKIDSMSGTVEIGAGLTWDQVYTNLEPTGVNVVGARTPTVGVAGLTLGGGRCLSSSETYLICFQAMHIRQVGMDLRSITSLDTNLCFRMELY